MTLFEVWYIMEDFRELKCWTYTSLESAHKYPAQGVRNSKGVIGYRVQRRER